LVIWVGWTSKCCAASASVVFTIDGGVIRRVQAGVPLIDLCRLARLRRSAPFTPGRSPQRCVRAQAGQKRP
jgi:hypothetical protein